MANRRGRRLRAWHVIPVTCAGCDSLESDDLLVDAHQCAVCANLAAGGRHGAAGKQRQEWGECAHSRGGCAQQSMLCLCSSGSVWAPWGCMQAGK
eukprot:116208-Pelagomonas_calceolata.AAC.4